MFSSLDQSPQPVKRSSCSNDKEEKEIRKGSFRNERVSLVGQKQKVRQNLRHVYPVFLYDPVKYPVPLARYKYDKPLNGKADVQNYTE